MPNEEISKQSNKLYELTTSKSLQEAVVTDEIIHDFLTADLEFTNEQIEKDDEAEKYISKWKSGDYSFRSLKKFLSKRFDYLCKSIPVSKKVRCDREALLEHLYTKEPKFTKALHEARKTLGIDRIEPPEKVYANSEEVFESITQQFALANTETNLHLFVEVALQTCNILRLDSVWQPVIKAQIASPKVKQTSMLKQMETPKNIIITMTGQNAIIACISPNFTRKDCEILKKTIRPLLKPTITKVDTDMNVQFALSGKGSFQTAFNGADGIWGYIKHDRQAGLSWNELSKKYNISADTIKKRLG